MGAAPEIVVVAATHERPRRLQALLASLEAQTLAPDRFEVVIVDDASGPETAAVLGAAEARGRLGLVVRSRAVSGGPGVARNEGWRASRAQLVAFTDDDCEAAPGWLEALVEAAAREPGAALQGPTAPLERERETITPFTRTIEVNTLGPWYQTCNILYPRALLERLEGFDERMPWGGEDTDLAWRAMEGGARMAWVPDAGVEHAVVGLGRAGLLRHALRWSDAMLVFARHGELREELDFRIFWKRSHLLLLVAVAGTGLATRRPLAGLLAGPYLRLLRRRLRLTGGTPADAPVLLAHDLLELYATVRGGVRHRVLVV